MKYSAFVVTVFALWLGSASLGGGEDALVLTPESGFSGVSEGVGSLKWLFGKPRPFTVISRGRDLGEGTFRIDQTITFAGQFSEARFWEIKTIRKGHHRGTLSDAAGPVSGVTQGAVLRLKYRIKGPLVMRQRLELLPDGRTIDNVGRITFFGIPIGRLEEVIRKVQ